MPIKGKNNEWITENYPLVIVTAGDERIINSTGLFIKF